MVQPSGSAWRSSTAATVARHAGRKTKGHGTRSQARSEVEQLAAETGIPLVAGKLTPPRTSSRLVSRPVLDAMLDDGVRRLLTLVSAPAGSGKTTQLSSWGTSGQAGRPVAWLSLDRRDNDPARFWTYVLAALACSGAVPAGGTVRSLVPAPTTDEAFLPALVSGLAELPTPVVLILDDLHEITEGSIFDGLEFLLRCAPPELRLVMSTRADPPLPLQRLAIAGELSQIRAADLSFSVSEIGQLLAEFDYREKLSDDDLRLLRARTEGWAAGLRLAALSLQHQPDPQRFVAELAGDDRTIADYLVAEVLDQMPERQRRFLLRTCVVDELNGELADALTGGHDGEWTLSALERVNAFVVALGSRRAAYRYHGLFAGLLRYELRRQAPHEIPELHGRAARWYAEHGLAVEAIHHLLLARDWPAAAELIGEHGLRLALRGDAATLRSLLDRLPGDVVKTDPELALLAAADRIVSYEPDAAHGYLELALRDQELVREDRRERFAVLLATCRTGFARLVGDFDVALDAGRSALALQTIGQANPAGDGALAVTLANLGAAELWTGDLVAAESHLRDGEAVATRAGLGHPLIDCTSQLAMLYAMRGELRRAFRFGMKGVELASRNGWTSLSRTAGSHLALAWVHYERDDLTGASRRLEQAVSASQADRDRAIRSGIAIVEAFVRRARNDPTGSLESVESARRSLAGRTQSPQLWRWLMLTEAELRDASGHPEAARELRDRVRAALDECSPLRPMDAMALASLQLAAEDHAATIETLEPFLAGPTPAGSLSALARAWLLDAFARDALAERDQAAASLERALVLAEREEAHRSFLDAGAPARSLLARYRDRIPAVASYLDRLLRAASEPAAAAALPPRLIEPLTERELVVLRYLPGMMTYEEIASDLFVSPNTIKSHVQSIFRKLSVTGRRQAVRSAREYRLL